MSETNTSEAIHSGTSHLWKATPKEILAYFDTALDETRQGLLGALPSLLAVSQSLATDKPRKIVIGGAGSSGRVAFIASQKYRGEYAQNGIQVEPYIAGGLPALRRTEEGAEDAGSQAIQNLSSDWDSSTVFIGVSCGLSASVVAAGIEKVLSVGGRAVLLGNNRITEASTRTFSSLANRSFREVLNTVEQSKNRNNFFPIELIVGPELLQGSSRLKGGSSTLLGLEMILDFKTSAMTVEKLAGVVDQTINAALNDPLRTKLPQLMQEFAAAIRSITYCGRVLAQGGVQYLGDGAAGAVGMLDASEIPPTFGAMLDEVTAWTTNGWRDVAYPSVKELTAIADLDQRFPASISQRTIVPGSFVFDTTSSKAVSDFSLKEILNALSTGGYTLAGKVVFNRMIDVRASNEKLIARARGIVADIAQVSPTVAAQSLINAISILSGRSVSTLHSDQALAQMASVLSGVVPCAICLALGRDSRRALELAQSKHSLALEIEQLLAKR